MKLEDQVCSLEQAKKLKELGVSQESLFWWLELYQGPEDNFNPRYFLNSGKHKDIEIQFSAFTVAELGEMLPVKVENVYQEIITTHTGSGEWKCAVRNVISGDWPQKYQIDADTEADARAKMLIYLLENNLVDITDPN